MTTALRAIKRSPREIEREIRSHQEFYDHLRDLAADFAALDVRPFYWHDGKITYTRDLNIPQNLRDMLQAEAEKIAELKAEYYG